MARRGGDKYESIINAAIKVFAEHGYHNAQVARIAREAGVADGTIYLYFENKADVLISVFRETMGALVSMLRENIAPFERAEDKLRELVRSHFTALSEDIHLAIVTQVELRQSNPEIREGITPSLKQYLDVIDEIIILGKEQGVFREDLIVHVVRKIIFGTLDETVTSWVMSPKKHNLLNLVDPIHDCLVNGFKK